MKTPAIGLLYAALAAGFGLAASPAHADPFEIRLQTQRALEDIGRSQRESIRQGAIEGVAAEVQALAAAETGRDAAPEELTADRGGHPDAAPVAVEVTQTPAPQTSQRGNKFALPYFSFGRLTTGRKNP
jgi:hypothetical protein